MFKRNHRGFTLVELLVVIAIIGLLSTLAVASLSSAKKKSRDAKRLADLSQVRSALELYAADANDYPLGTTVDFSASATSRLCSYTATQNTFVSTCATGTDILMAKLPTDPSTSTTSCTKDYAAGTCKYSYTRIGAGQYEIYTYLEGTANNGALDKGICLSEVGFSNTGCDH